MRSVLRRALRRGQHKYTPAYTQGVIDALRMEIGQVGLVESRFLASLVVSSAHARPVVEIGTLFGHSTNVIAASKAPSQPFYTVDNYSWNPFGLSSDRHREIARERLAEAIAELHLTVIDANKRSFFQTYSAGPPALVFIDADHSYKATCEDIEWAKRVGASIICGHDYAANFPGVIEAVLQHGGPEQVVGSLWKLSTR